MEHVGYGRQPKHQEAAASQRQQTIMKLGTLTTALLCMACISPALAQVRVNTHLGRADNFNKVNPYKNGLSRTDRNFIRTAYAANSFEVRISQLAQTNASDMWVRDFGQDMIREHAMANKELKLLARQRRFTLPSSWPSKLTMTYKKLSRLHGEAFDHAYTKINMGGHNDAINLCSNEVKKGNDSMTRGYATKLLASAKMHQNNMTSAATMLARNRYTTGTSAQPIRH